MSLYRQNQQQSNIVTPEQYFRIALSKLQGCRQPLLMWSDSKKKFILGDLEFDENDENFYKYYVYILRHHIGIPNFEREMNLKLTDDGRTFYLSTLTKKLNKSSQ